MGKVIAVSNQKGGVGKTTTCVNLAASISSIGKKMLLIDFDPQGNSTSGFGIDKNNIQTSIYEVLIGKATIEEIIQVSDIPELYIIPTNINLAGAEIELIGYPNREFKLKESIAGIIHKYDYILIDCPPSLNLLTINALVASNSVLIPLQCEFYAMEGMSQLFLTINTVKQKLNTSLSIEGILPTMYDIRNNISSQVIDEARDYFDNYVLNTVIPRNVRLSEAPSYGRPILLYDKYSKGSLSYLKLAQEIVSNNQRKNTQK